MLTKIDNHELITKYIGRDIVIITKNNSDIKFKKVITDIPSLYMLLKYSINISNTKLKPDYTIDIELTNLPLIICCPNDTLLRLYRIPKLYFTNLIYEFNIFTIGSCSKLEDTIFVLYNFIQYQQLSIKLTIDKLKFKDSIIRQDEPITELNFTSSGNRNINNIYVIENDELYRQFFITTK